MRRFESTIWQTSAILGRAADGSHLVVDPCYFPVEVDAIAAAWRAARDRDAGPAAATRLVVTHADWDHLVGWARFPGATVVGSAALVARLARDAGEIAAEIARFDGAHYVERGGPWRPPPAVVVARDGEELAPGVLAVESPGHTEDGLAIVVASERTLVAGDYLSPCEIPFVEHSLEAYARTLARLRALLDGAGAGPIERVVPGHGPPLAAAAARRLADEDARYLDALRRAAEGRAGDVPLPRAAGVPGMAEAHARNLARARREAAGHPSGTAGVSGP